MTFRITGLSPEPFRPLFGLSDAQLAARGARRTIAWLDEQGKIESWEVDDFEDRLIAAWNRLETGLTAEAGEE